MKVQVQPCDLYTITIWCFGMTKNSSRVCWEALGEATRNSVIIQNAQWHPRSKCLNHRILWKTSQRDFMHEVETPNPKFVKLGDFLEGKNSVLEGELHPWVVSTCGKFGNAAVSVTLSTSGNLDSLKKSHWRCRVLGHKREGRGVCVHSLLILTPP